MLIRILLLDQQMLNSDQKLSEIPGTLDWMHLFGYIEAKVFNVLK